MAAPGQKPVPTALKIIRGNPGRRPLPPNEFKPPLGAPTCPRHLTAEARAEWNRLVKQFTASGMLAHIDRGMLAMMCTAWGDHVCARRAIAKRVAELGDDGMWEKAQRSGMLMQSPWLTLSHKSLELYSRIAVEFGMTPSARTRVQHAPIMPAAHSAVPKASGWKQFDGGGAA